jgi:glycosyltransferase involved in cell wall biosynthesis
MGPLPPPVTGQTLLTEKVVQRLKQEAPIAVTNWASGDSRPRLHLRVLRLLRTIGCLAKLILHGRVRNTRLYLTGNSKGGLLMTGLIVNAARRLGYTIYLHHHVYYYLDEYDKRMAWINRSMGPDDVHLVHCSKMVDDFRAVYPTPCRFEVLYPSIVSLPLGQPRQRVREPFCLGFLSNLRVEKGLDLVLETFRVLRESGRNVRLSLAGPWGDSEATKLVTDALKQYVGHMNYVGAVYGDRKVEYLDSIDALLFPSKSESWGIVLNEALARGAPVIVVNRGCIETLVGCRAGLVVDDEIRYVSEAVRQVEAWIDSPNEFIAASQAAIDQADHLQREATIQLEQLVSRICTPDPVGPDLG